MVIKKLLTAIGCCAILLAYQSCDTKKSKPLPIPALYDLNNPTIFSLPVGLAEISGMAYYPKDSSVFAIIDEAGTLFKIYLNGTGTIKKWTYNKKEDFEDIVMVDSTFYVLISNGDIASLQFSGDSILVNKSNLAGNSKKVNEFETLYYDDSLGIILMCKECEEDDKKKVTAIRYNPDSSNYQQNLYSINTEEVIKMTGEKKLHLKPSAAAIHPITKDLYIIASVNRLLLIADRSGNVKEVYPLDPLIYKQPEGITFTPWGDLLISNEAAESGNPNILILKSKKKG